MPKRARPCTALPAAQTHLRCGSARTEAAMKSCGSRAPASRSGTSRPTIQAGAPSAPKSQDRTSLGSTRPSPVLVAARLATWRVKFRGCALQASSGMSRQILPSSSAVSRS